MNHTESLLSFTNKKLNSMIGLNFEVELEYINEIRIKYKQWFSSNMKKLSLLSTQHIKLQHQAYEHTYAMASPTSIPNTNNTTSRTSILNTHDKTSPTSIPYSHDSMSRIHHININEPRLSALLGAAIDHLM